MASQLSPAKIKELTLLANEVVQGLRTLNPLLLKNLAGEALKELYNQVRRLQIATQNERVMSSDPKALRERSHKLQRVLQTLTVIETEAKERKLTL